MIRRYAKEMELKKAVEKAVEYCIGNDILSDFLKKNRAEAIAVSIFEYDEEKHIKNEKQISYNEGREEGVKEGEKRLNLLHQKLIEANRMEDLKRSIVDEEYRKELMKSMIFEDNIESVLGQ